MAGKALRGVDRSFGGNSVQRSMDGSFALSFRTLRLSAGNPETCHWRLFDVTSRWLESRHSFLLHSATCCTAEIGGDSPLRTIWPKLPPLFALHFLSASMARVDMPLDGNPGITVPRRWKICRSQEGMV